MPAEIVDHPRYRREVYAAVRGISSVWMYGLHRMTATGQDNVPKTGGVVLAPTHRSLLDIPAVGVPLKRSYRAMAKAELFEIPVLGAVIRNGGTFPVRRGEQDMEAYERALRLLRGGEMLLIFPEGTRNVDGKTRPQLGAARLALESGAQLVPAAIVGSSTPRLWPPRVPKLRVAYGPPIEIDDLRDTGDLRRASFTATKRWTEASSALLASIR